MLANVDREKENAPNMVKLNNILKSQIVNY